MTEHQTRSILAADFGSVNTRVLLFDIVDGAYRLVAQGLGPTSIGSPADDARLGLSKILREIGAATDRRFLDERGRLIQPEQSERVGVDKIVTAASAGAPIRTVIVGLYPRHSMAAVKRAIAPFYLDVVAEAHLEDGLTSRGRLNRIVHSRPGLIIVTGGADGGARTVLLQMLALVRQAVTALPASEKPALLYAGNSALAPSVREMLAQQVEVTVAANIRGPAGDAPEATQAALQRIFDAHKRGRSSFRRLAGLSQDGIQPTARGIETMAAFFARMTGRDVLAADIGSAHGMLSLAGKAGVLTALRHDVGLGHSASALLEAAGETALAQWLPFHLRKGELEQYALDKGLRVASVPLDMRARTIEYAFLRAGMRCLLAELAQRGQGTPMQLARDQIGLVLLCGATLTGSGQGALDMLLLADALDCEGIVQVKADPYGALAALGALAGSEPAAVVQLLGGNALQDVGHLIRVTGAAPAGSTALKYKLKRADGAVVEGEVMAGDVWHFKLPAAESVELRLQARRGLSIGGKRRIQRQVAGGRGGLLFDARLDALAPAASISERAVAMLRWFAAVTEQDKPVAIPEDWLARPGD